MENNVIDQIEQFLASAPYHDIFVLAHPEIVRLNAAVAALQRHYGWPQLFLSAELSSALHDVRPQQRPFRIPGLLHDVLYAHAPGPLLCADIALLFEPGWQINPLGLFLEASRRVRLIVAWPGSYENDVLAYAVPAHGHYRAWAVSDLVGQAVSLPAWTN